jgi:hypothetical protein
MSEAQFIYVISIMFGAFWMFKLYKIYTAKNVVKKETNLKSKQTLKKKPKNQNFDSDYSDVLNSEKYRVKGKFEF